MTKENNNTIDNAIKNLIKEGSEQAFNQLKDSLKGLSMKEVSSITKLFNFDRSDDRIGVQMAKALKQVINKKIKQELRKEVSRGFTIY